MKFTVSLCRTSTASRDVEIDDPSVTTSAQARAKALEEAGDTDFAGCVVDYTFDVTGVEPDDGTEDVDLASEEKRCPDLGYGVCSVCQKTPFPGVSQEVIDAGWLPEYFEGQEECDGPVCPNCAAQFIREVEGEWTLLVAGEYVSTWDGGVEVRSPCTVDPRTRKVEIEHASDVEGLETMEREYVVLNGTEYEAANEEARAEFTPEQRSRMFFWD